ncbi:MAG: hypothetical protein JOZ18_14955 [Chloroflexi bacterium]|nr:hypothetical protein [Chloroflexota bacterium]
MSVSNRSIFRKTAINHYMHSREKKVKHRFTPLSATVFLWALFGLLVVAGAFAWYEQVPLYVSGTGVVINKGITGHKGNAVRSRGGEASDEIVAIVFLPPDQSSKLQIGLPVQLHIGLSGLQLNRSIAEIEPGLISPYSALKRYGLNGNCCSLITQPSVVVLVGLGTAIPTMYAGSMLTAEVKIGTERVLPLLLGWDGVRGE